MEKKHLIGGVLVVVAIVAFFGYPHVRLLQFKMDADKFMLDDFGRFPTAQQIIDVDAKITTVAQKHGFKSATCAKRITMRSTAGTSDMFFVLQMEVTVDGGKSINLSRRIDTGGLENEFERLQESGIKIPGQK